MKLSPGGNHGPIYSRRKRRAIKNGKRRRAKKSDLSNDSVDEAKGIKDKADKVKNLDNLVVESLNYLHFNCISFNFDTFGFIGRILR